MVEINGQQAKIISSGSYLAMKHHAEDLKWRGFLLAYKLVIVKGEECVLYGITRKHDWSKGQRDFIN